MSTINTNVIEAMKPYFDELGIDPIEFNYIVDKNRFISKKSFQNENDDPEAYYIVIKINDNIGTVVTGVSDGIKFDEVDVLGQIGFDGQNWIKL